MAIQTTQIFLGDTQVPLYYLGENQVSISPSTAPIYVVRNDEFAQYVKFAAPYSSFGTQFDMYNYYSDISSFIRLSGSNIQMQQTGSTVNGVSPIFQQTSSLVISGSSFDWSDDGYSTSVYISGSQNAGIITGSILEFSTQNFVIECWIKPVQVTMSQPPFNILIFGNVDGSPLLCDYSIISGFRFFAGSASATNAVSYSDIYNKWNHIAYVKSGNNLYFYLNGNRLANTGGTSGNIGQPDDGYWRVFGNVVGNNNDGAGKFVQDLRITIGSDRNYTGSIFTPPQSIVTLANY